MANSESSEPNDLLDLGRFIEAQNQHQTYSRALTELRRGNKTSHWMWFVFPQVDGLGYSSMSKRYAIHSREEAQAYLDHPVLGERLRECAEALMSVEGKSAAAIMGSPDDMKLQSSMTLFAHVAEPDSVFTRVLEKYYEGETDKNTLQLL